MEPAPTRSTGDVSTAEANADGANRSSNNARNISGARRHGGSGSRNGGRLRRSGGGAIPPATANLFSVQQELKKVSPQQPCPASRSALESEEEESKMVLAVSDDVKPAGSNLNKPDYGSVAAVTALDSQSFVCESERVGPAAGATSIKSPAEAESGHSDGRKRRRQWWWWRQHQRHRRRRSQSQPEIQEIQRRCEVGSHFKAAVGPYRSALYMNPSIRCVGSDGLPYRQSFKELLRPWTAGPVEVDTPCLRPIDAPLCVQQCSNAVVAAPAENEDGLQLRAVREEEGLAVRSPMITFTLDGVATPKTFAVIKRQEVDVGVISLSASCSVGEDTEKRRMQALPPIRPPHAIRVKELPHQRILRSYVNGSFLFYQTEGTKREFLLLFREILAQVRPIFEAEPLFPRLVAPTFVFGDIHGNFEDLAFFLRNVLIFHDLQLTPANVLCLGDYVDRGPYSLECLMLLLSLKISHPSRVILLRGNHEDRVVCGDVLTYGSASFLAQCEALYGLEEGRRLFREATALFRHFPLAAELLIPSVPNICVDSNGSNNVNTTTTATTNSNNDNKAGFLGDVPVFPISRSLAPLGRRRTHEERILCTHGGIPRFFCPPKEDDSLAFLRREDFPRMLTLFPNNPFVKDDPEAQMRLLEAVGQTGVSQASLTPAINEAALRKAWYVAFDLMWSDPTSTDPGDENDDTDSTACIAAGSGHVDINEWGFGVNKRGSNVLTFSAKAVDTFLQAHQYSMLFRAHQEKAHGLRVSKSRKVLTIFSSSNYLGHGNGAGCALVNADGEIQLIEKLSE
ncbi:putative serine/threonine protein phosphatase-like protein [Trypanosoma rangeli]|uniref:Serine/threonine-protein phosphatase n=1 Tax=Trypanosoma rangeli TaxID=5698 RepID=A0A422N057_TRYRA|nr:putative serine/threonine protein phosphatase-like protein [Trypanosoma rangeli]RNE98810.1 putative serine/threonine protein phosphatase-like protein [Trypanosoma rangeli]|eukprot:RNE98810.1 putative serine/threonine protein phosphatase-like protein [Trypanosoma rangeli]